MNLVFYIVIALGVVAGVLAALLILRARKAPPLSVPCCTGAAAVEEKPSGPLRNWLDRLLSTLDYLSTRREWRYQTPWVLLLGEQGCGKSSLAASASHDIRHSSPSHQAQLNVEGTDWQFFDQGVLIDLDGRLPAAGGADWERVLRDIDALRPERAVDGVLMTVSAHTLLTASAEQRLALADNAYQQLCAVQEQFEFVLPVYVVVTGCDHIDGFGEFWQAQPPQMRKELFGWSAPPSAASAAPGDWANSVFDAMAEQLKALQLQAAAVSDKIAGTDRFFLFPRHFQALRAPIRQWLTVVFQPSSWHAGFLCRGVYFTGSVAAGGDKSGEVRKDVAFVDHLISRKVLAEQNLAQPTRQGVWSRNKMIRNMQLAGVALFSGLIVALAVAGYRLERQVDALVTSLNLVQKTSASPEQGNACVEKDRVYQLLTQIARINVNSIYAAIPASWFDWRASRRSAHLIADAAFQRVVLPSLACHLELRAQQLSMETSKTAAAGKTAPNGYAQARQSLFDYMQAVQALELNMERFRQLATYSPSSESERLMRALSDLAEYVYQSPLPNAVAHEHGALSAALVKVRYNGETRLSSRLQQHYSGRIINLAGALHHQLGQEVGKGEQLLGELTRMREPVLSNARHFSRWLDWVKQSWLGSTPSSNPCEEIRAAMHSGVQALVHRYGYSAELQTAVNQFNTRGCYSPSKTRLTGLQIPPHGMIFTARGNELVLNPALAPDLDGLSSLMALDFMQARTIRPFTCQPAGAGWRAAEIAQAGNYVREYQGFRHKQGLAPIGTGSAELLKRPLYDRLAAHQLERVLNNSLLDAQFPAASRSPLQQVGFDALSMADQQLAERSTEFGKTVEPLLNVLRMYDQVGLSESGSTIKECVRRFAVNGLAEVDRLVNISRLYDPGNDFSDGALFDLGATPVTVDYLARQVSRSQVLAGYASPLLAFLQNSDPVNDAQRANAQSTPYWSNTIGELNRYVQFKEPAGQVAQLHNLFLKQLADLTTATCPKTIAAYQRADYGNDLFSKRRQQLEAQMQLRCTNRKKAEAYGNYTELAARFNRDLAGRYPFADFSAPDASPAAIKAFFADYDTRRAALRQALSGLAGDDWNAQRRFLDQLDAVSAFFSSNLTAGETSQPIKLAVGFRALPNASPGSDQVLSWNLSAGTRSAGYPNRPTALDWQYGQPLVLDLLWADRSLWRPVSDPQQADLQVDGASASYASSGDWALLRLIERHRPKSGQSTDPFDPKRLVLEFAVPVASTDAGPAANSVGAARLYLSLKLAAQDPKTQAPVALTLPASFPRIAPQ